MLAFKCDRCGQYYKFYDLLRVDNKTPVKRAFDYINEADEGNGITIRTRELDTDFNYKTIKNYDLCPECMSAIYRFIKNKGVKSV